MDGTVEDVEKSKSIKKMFFIFLKMEGRSEDELLSLIDLPNDVSEIIWTKAIIDNDMYFEEALKLSKTFRQINTLFGRRGNDPLWRHF